MSDVVKYLQLLFDRPGEPLFTPKGVANALFQMSEEFLPNKYKKIGIKINHSFEKIASQIIQLQPLRKPPSYPLASQLPVEANFSVFLPKHQRMADEVIAELLGVPENDLLQFLAVCVYSRVNLNPQLFNYCFAVALMHRKDTRNVPIKNVAEVFPSKFMDSQVFTQTREAAWLADYGAPRVPIEMPWNFTASDLDVEHRLAYFREDIGVNLHHWHWHVVYPFSAAPANIALVNKDRRGELFYYMHQQLIARYNGERLNNSLLRVKKFNNWTEVIPDGYFSKLTSLTAARGWPPRQAGMRWRDLDRPSDDLRVTIADMERWRRNLDTAIATGKVQRADGKTQSLDIDILGNMVEASILSPNAELYGNLHNNGHRFAALMQDPDDHYLESFGVMGDETTAMRDTFFYQWHAFIDDLFQRHKESPHVPSYTGAELGNPGVQVTKAEIETESGARNELNTFWMMTDMDVSRGLDFSTREPTYVRFTHLNHRPFRYVINVNNTGAARRTTVRIFLAPKINESRQPWLLSEQRKMFIEMDRFVVPLNAGQNTITRLSTDSSVTIPFEQTFRIMCPGVPEQPSIGNYCGCGWPQHMLVPKGTVAGAAYQLFVMLSDYELDKVEQHIILEETCKEASSFCGLKDQKYPDKRAMGFPFDRPYSNASHIEDFILPNMALVDVTVRLQDVREPNPNNACH